jgi:hypothetical protein
MLLYPMFLKPQGSMNKKLLSFLLLLVIPFTLL